MIHSGAASEYASAALPDIRRQRVRGVPDHRNPSRRPSLQLDQFEAIVASVVAEPIDQLRQVRKGRFPFRLAQRHGFRDFVRVQHRQRHIDLVLAAWRVEDAAASRPVFDRLAGLRGAAFLLRLADQQTDRAIREELAPGKQFQRVAQLRLVLIARSCLIPFRGEFSQQVSEKTIRFHTVFRNRRVAHPSNRSTIH